MTPSDIPSTQARLKPEQKLTEGVANEKPPFQLNVDPEWLIRMAEKEDCRIVSVGGFFTRVEDRPAIIQHTIVTKVPMLPDERTTNDDESLTPAQILAELIDYPPDVDDQAEKPSIMIMPINQQRYIADTLQRQPTQEDIDWFIASCLESPDE